MSALEALLFQEEALFDLPAAKARSLTLEFTREAFAWHFTHCPEYSRYCARVGVSPSTSSNALDLAQIPLLPTSLFKRFLIRSCSEAEIEKICLSSGTQGGQSRVVRDQRTLERFLGSVHALLQLAPQTRESAAQLFVLGPDTDEASDLWLAYVLSVTELLYPARFYVSHGRPQLEHLIADLEASSSAVQPILIGPPAMMLDLADTVKRRGAKLNLERSGGYVITAGGWKRANDRAVERASFGAIMGDALGLSDPRAVRDCFNMVELNSVLMTCHEGNFHLPPTLYMTARSVENLRPLSPNEEGVIAFCDATATSYPAFVLSDDFGIVGDYASCSCGLSSPWFRPTRRLSTVEARGCARKIDALAVKA